MRIFTILCLFLLSATKLTAQITGEVRDGYGEPLPGANIYWLNTSDGTTADESGEFKISKPSKSNTLVVSFIGYKSDTIKINGKSEKLSIILKDGMMTEEVQVVVRKLGTLKLRSSVLNEDMISSAELARAACCNLGESFTTNPSVDVSYSDAATGAKQIKLLGLSGTYVQLLTENIPNYRGAAAPFSLGYIPGPWMQSIQVSKGSSSVKNGYEAITGQINVEFMKPQLPQYVNVNLFTNSKERYEANFTGNIHLNKRLSTAIFAHYENGTKTHDDNGDGFLDMPRIEQYNFQNRWAWMGDRYVFQATLKAISEKRNSGQAEHAHAATPATRTAENMELYKIGIKTHRYEAFTKNAFIFNKEKNTNLALILSGSIHQQDAGYGHKVYDVDQHNVYANLMFETNFNSRNSISMGTSVNYDYFDQDYRITNDMNTPLTKSKVKETVPGAYVQYTYNLNDKLILMGGFRGDHSSLYGTFFTPRAHIKYIPSDMVHLRASAGKGYRTNHVLAENNFLLASGRNVIIDPLDQEEAWNYGFSTSFYFTILNKTLNINAEYYYTDFKNQMIVDMDSDPHAIHFTNLKGKSYSHTVQVEASYPFFKGFNLIAAYRYSDVKATYGDRLLEKPLTSKYKGLVTASYQTPLGFWQFDVTLQLNGGGRMPTPYATADGSPSWDSRYKSFEQLNAQVTYWRRYWSVYVGGENLTNFKQKVPIIDAGNPWGSNFDSTMVWGPVHGAMFYIGLRFNWFRT